MTTIALPRDDAVRPDTPVQWWYWTGHLQTQSGRQFGFELVFFALNIEAEIFGRRFLGPHFLEPFEGGQAVHHAITDIEKGTFQSRVHYIVGMPREIDNAFDLHTPLPGESQIRASGGNGQDHIHGEVDNYVLDLSVDAAAPPVLHYDGDKHDYAFGGDTLYYSREWMNASGTIRCDEQTLEVEGKVWFDRQWGDLEPAVHRGWQWFAIQLDDKTRIMLFDFCNCPAELYGSVTSAAGQTRTFGAGDYQLDVLDHWVSPHTGIRYPAAWHVQIADHDFVVVPVLPDQEIDELWEYPHYWEGTCRVEDHSGKTIGQAYVELSGFSAQKARGEKPRVLVVGGGIAGMSAAQELIARNFDVKVVESKPVPGGKARSVQVPNTGRDGRPDLPGEHGFRFFPRFYRHITSTMKQIPYTDPMRPGEKLSTYDNLVQASREMLARIGKPAFVMPARFPRSLADLKLMYRDAHNVAGLGIPDNDLDFFAERIWQLMTSCRARKVQDYERIGWSEYLEGAQRGGEYKTLLVDATTRTLVAANPETASTQVGGEVLTEIIYGVRPGPSTDQLLNGPTSDVWIYPWLEFLREQGVDYQLSTPAEEILFEDGLVTGVVVNHDGQRTVEVAECYLFAVPVEVMYRLLEKTPAIVEADPVLDGMKTLAGDVGRMNGVQFYLKKPTNITNGHVVYVGSPWALTSISQEQFWEKHITSYGDGQVRGILSVAVSEWNKPGIANPVDPGDPSKGYKIARMCNREEILADVWAQLKQNLNVDGKEVLRDEDKLLGFVDPDVGIHAGGDTDAEPLLVNKIKRWQLRPNADTEIPNMFLASDYVRTNTNLATMEAANEAARRAVNCIIDAADVDAPYCEIWKLYQPWILAPMRWHDARRFARGLPWDPRPPLLIRLAHFLGAVLGTLWRWLRNWF